MSTNNAAISIENECINDYKCYCTLGYLHSIARMAKCADAWRAITESTENPSPIYDFIAVAKIGSKDLATFLVHQAKGAVEHKLRKRENNQRGIFSLKISSDVLNLELRFMHLE